MDDAHMKDFFAALALQGLVTHRDIGSVKDVAQLAYALAEAMMKERANHADSVQD